MKSDISKQTNCIFQQPWWLDAVFPNRWNAIEINRGGQIVARFPYTIRKTRGITLLTMPPLTQTLGPWFAKSTAKYAKRLAHQKDLMTSLIEQLPPFDYFCQNFHYSITNWLPFYWHGFTQSTRYTYIIDNLVDLDEVWSGLQENIRTDIRKAQRRIIVGTNLDVDRFLDINCLTFQRQGKSLPYSRELVRRLDNACIKQDARRIFFAEDAQGRIHAAVYIVWDNNSAYYLMGGANPNLRNSGATSLLLWEAIKFTATVTQRFDFEGSMVESIERFFRAFGARQVPYFQISCLSRRYKFYQAMKAPFKSLLIK